VGGLADTVTDCTAATLADHTASGFTFHEFTPEGLRAALHRAFDLYRHPADWIAVQHHAMQLRFDWQVAAQAYATLFQRLAPPSGTGPA
jgi:starch synthase